MNSQKQRLPAALLAVSAAGPGQHATKLARSMFSGQIEARLRESIISGELEGGTPLVETRLAEQLAVSRGPVRSALHALESEGLVQTAPNGRMHVVGFDAAALNDLTRVRFDLESRGIRWGIEAGAGTSEVEEAFQRLASERTEPARLVERDLDFHYALVSMSGSRFFAQAWLALAPVIAAVITIGNRELAYRDPESNFARIVESHRRIVDAIRRGDEEGSEAMLAEQFAVTASMFERRSS